MSFLREAAIRASPSPHSPLFSSTRISRCLATCRRIPRPVDTAYICRSCRTFSSQAWRRQQAAAQTSVVKQNPVSERPASLDAKDERQLNEALDQNHPLGIASKQTHHYKSLRAQLEQRATTTPRPSHLQDPARTAATARTVTRTTFLEPSRTAAYLSDRTGQAQRESLKGIMFPTTGMTDATGRRSITEMEEKPPEPDQDVYEAMNLTSRTGKTLAVDAKSPTDLAVKLTKLEMLTARNRVRQDLFRQKFHERPGLKRKRLKSERWRRRFKASFIKTVARVQELKRKGW